MEKTSELVNFCEIDQYATKSYCAIHSVNPNKNLGDITQVNENNVPEFNCIFGGSPCQDFSVAGKGAGSTWKCLDCGCEYNPITVHYSKRAVCPSCRGGHLDKTRSSLLVEWLRIIRANKPNWGIYENVKNITGKKFRDTFDLFIQELEEYGYNVYWKVLNAKDYGVPQNRERVYVIIVKKELDNGKFVWPEPFDNGIRLKDLLEPDVAEKYYTDTPTTRRLIKELVDSGKLDKALSKDSSNAIRTGGGQKPSDRQTQLGCYFSGCGQRTKPRLIDVASTCAARYYKGFYKQETTGIVEYENNDDDCGRSG